MHVLTRKEWAMLTFIQSFIDTNGYAPTLREIAESTGAPSLSAVFYAIEELAELGVISRKPGCARSLRVVRGVTVGVLP